MCVSASFYSEKSVLEHASLYKKSLIVHNKSKCHIKYYC